MYMELSQDTHTSTNEEPLTHDQTVQTQPKRRGRPPKVREEPPPKPPRPPKKERPLKMHKPLATEDPHYANKYYHAHLAFKVRCPYCDSELVFQKLARHVREAQKCRVQQQEHVIKQMQEKLQTLEQTQPEEPTDP
jgi:hypothetical protein